MASEGGFLKDDIIGSFKEVEVEVGGIPRLYIIIFAAILIVGAVGTVIYFKSSKSEQEYQGYQGYQEY